MPGPLSEEHLRLAERSALAARDRAVEKVEGLAFTSYHAASRVPPDLAQAPERTQEAFRRAVRDRLLVLLREAWPRRVHATDRPDVMVEAVPDQRDAAVRVTPVLVGGRYRKLSRDLSQTAFHCRDCRGRKRAREGCATCGGTGRLVPESVEDFVRGPLVRAFEAKRGSFHGAGREDVDVRMLGTGRPFVVSVERPRVRHADLEAVAATVTERSGGRVEITDLRQVSRGEMRRITAEHGEKTYLALVRAEAGFALPDAAAERLAVLDGAEVAQRTPRRVERRADKVRRRRVLSLRVVEESSVGGIRLEIRTEPGTYVKEFVSGDGGRTEPSVAGVLGVPCVCAELDVTAVG